MFCYIFIGRAGVPVSVKTVMKGRGGSKKRFSVGELTESMLTCLRNMRVLVRREGPTQ